MYTDAFDNFVAEYLGIFPVAVAHRTAMLRSATPEYVYL